MYASFSNHLEQGAHYAFAFAVLFWLWPKVLFHRFEGDTAERALANFTRMVLLVIAMGYILVVTRLFEMIAILTVLTFWAMFRWVRKHTADKRGSQLIALATLCFDYFEGKYKLVPIVRQRLSDYMAGLGERFRRRLSSPGTIAKWLLLLVVVAGAAYVRFYDAVKFAAPGMSDAYTVLEWMKDIDDRVLFKTGIYPKGFHIYLDTLFKFAKIDALYIDKYSGPLNSILTMLGMYFLVSRWTGQKIAGIVSAVVYGWLGWMVGGSWERQAATNSQEFAMVFLFPTLYFFRKYLQTGERNSFWTAASGLAVTGLVHQLIYGYLILGIAVLTAVHWLGGIRPYLRQTWRIVMAGAGSVVVSAIPAAIGLSMGKKFQEAAAKYLTGTTSNVRFPELYATDYMALGAAGLMLVCGLAVWKNENRRTAYMFTSLFTLLTFVLCYWGSAVTQSIVVASRSVELWGLIVPVALGMSWSVLFAGAANRTLRFVETAAVISLLGATLVFYPLKPIVLYKMEWDSNVEQYLRISESNGHRSWMIFSQEEEYPLVKGEGIHAYIKDLLENYDPSYKYLTLKGESEPNRKIPTEIYIYEEKQVFRTNRSFDPEADKKLAAEYDRREKEMRELQKWIQTYKEANGGIEVFYEDDVLRVYHISRPLTREEIVQQIWGKSD
ncbi:hypothetical protein [Paenibacillus hamazuiensis]|uniref:hypothetical protein n=1 Tax=Paenibacillus hamazuiensis TaxID=2936508 RepID=UPI00200CA6C8|nr:hypothetical protein [Paenibacillus hamazuiensis]